MHSPAVSLLDHIQKANELLRDLNRSRLGTDITQMTAGVAHELACAESVLRDLAGDALADMEGKVRNDAPETSRRAARRVVLRTGTQRSAILEHLGRFGAATDLAIQSDLEIQPSSERPRRGELVDAGLVEAVLEETGARATVRYGDSEWGLWQLTPAGRLALNTIGAGQQMTFDLD